MDEDLLLPWQVFTQDLVSAECRVTREIADFCEANPQALLDFRPYMILNPFSVHTTDTLEKCVSIFRNQHLRHLPVVHPGTGEIKGMITRKDLFRFMDL